MTTPNYTITIDPPNRSDSLPFMRAVRWVVLDNLAYLDSGTAYGFTEARATRAARRAAKCAADRDVAAGCPRKTTETYRPTV